MKRTLSYLIPFLLIVVTLTGCEAIGDLMSFAFWGGVIAVVLVLVLIFWIIRKIKK